MSRFRVRQHVNPLSQKYCNPIHLPEWSQIYANLSQPLHLDIGCAWGRFLLKMAQVQPDWNFLGLEIRRFLVDEANVNRDELGLTNLHYLFSNANNSLTQILASLPPNILQRVTIQFPDPWFKNRHHKRRLVQPEIVHNLAFYLPNGGEVFLQSDLEEIAQEMCDRFSSHPAFFRQNPDTWLAENPLPVATEREIATLTQNKPVYRALFCKLSTTN